MAQGGSWQIIIPYAANVLPLPSAGSYYIQPHSYSCYTSRDNTELYVHLFTACRNYSRTWHWLSARH